MIQLRKIISFDFHHIPKLSIGFKNKYFGVFVLNGIMTCSLKTESFANFKFQLRTPRANIAIVLLTFPFARLNRYLIIH